MLTHKCNVGTGVIQLSWPPTWFPVDSFLNFALFRFGENGEFLSCTVCFRGGAVASWLVRSSLDRSEFEPWPGDHVLCSWARHLTLTVPLSTQEYKWVPVNCWEKPNKLRGSDLRWTSIPSRGNRNTPSRRNRDKLRQLWVSTDSKASLHSMLPKSRISLVSLSWQSLLFCS